MNRALITCLAAWLVALPALAEDDVILRALDDELARAKTLHLDKVDRPYFLSAYAHDEDAFLVNASMGALTLRGGGTQGALGVNVRVGSLALDNSNFHDYSDYFGLFGGGNQGGNQGTPAEPDYDALRHDLWLQFDRSYKTAVETLAKKRAFLENKKIADRPDDFGPAKVAVTVLPKTELKVDRERWTALVKRASAVLRGNLNARTGDAGFSTRRIRQYFVTSEGTRFGFDEPLARFTLSAAAQAPDGMEVTAKLELDGRSEADLPTDEVLLTRSRELSARLDALVKAPALAEDYSGPVLFTGTAASEFFLQAIGEPLSAPRDALGEQRPGRMTERLGKHVTTKAITVRDDSSQQTWNGQPLLGYYPVDDDGVPPQPITLVQQGVLQTYFMSRIPTAKVKVTNGHSRDGQGCAGNLFVEATGSEELATLKKRLIELAKEEDLDFGLMVEEFQPRGDRGAWGEGTSAVTIPEPAVVKRVYLDGHEELVRGVRFKPAPYRVLKDIVGTGTQPTLLNTSLRGQRVSVVAPPVLIKTLDAQKPNEEFEKLPAIPRPQVAAAETGEQHRR